MTNPEDTVEIVLACAAGGQTLLVARDGLSAQVTLPLELQTYFRGLLDGSPTDAGLKRLLDFSAEVARSLDTVWTHGWPMAMAALRQGVDFDHAASRPLVAGRFRYLGHGRGASDLGFVEAPADRLRALREQNERSPL